MGEVLLGLVDEGSQGQCGSIHHVQSVGGGERGRGDTDHQDEEVLNHIWREAVMVFSD